MADYVVVDKSQLEADLTTVADAIRSKGGTTESLAFPLGMKEAVENIETGITPTGTIEITENGTYDVTEYANAEVNVVSNIGEFTGIIYSDFYSNYNLPRIADARNIPVPDMEYLSKNSAFTSSWFRNDSGNANGGYFVYLKDVYLPDGLYSFGTDMFRYCVNLENIYGNFKDIITISGSAFDQCKVLKEFPYMPNLTYISNYAFKNCVSLEVVKLYNTLTTFATNTFTNCTNLLDIYVPWSEGEVANAPWGAVNATIHYNTTYDENHNPIIQEV